MKIQTKVQQRVNCSIDATAAVVKLLLRSEPQFKDRKDVMAAVLAKAIVAKASHEDRYEEPVVSIWLGRISIPISTGEALKKSRERVRSNCRLVLGIA